MVVRQSKFDHLQKKSVYPFLIPKSHFVWQQSISFPEQWNVQKFPQQSLFDYTQQFFEDKKAM